MEALMIGLRQSSGTIVNTNADDDDISVSGDTASSSIYGGRQRDTIAVSGKVTDSLIRGDANEDQITLSGNLSGSFINGNANNDTITISSATITDTKAFGGKGDDTFAISGDAIYVDGGKGDDTIATPSPTAHDLRWRWRG